MIDNRHIGRMVAVSFSLALVLNVYAGETPSETGKYPGSGLFKLGPLIARDVTLDFHSSFEDEFYINVSSDPRAYENPYLKCNTEYTTEDIFKHQGHFYILTPKYFRKQISPGKMQDSKPLAYQIKTKFGWEPRLFKVTFATQDDTSVYALLDGEPGEKMRRFFVYRFEDLSFKEVPAQTLPLSILICFYSHDRFLYMGLHGGLGRWNKLDGRFEMILSSRNPETLKAMGYSDTFDILWIGPTDDPTIIRFLANEKNSGLCLWTLNITTLQLDKRMIIDNNSGYVWDCDRTYYRSMTISFEIHNETIYYRKNSFAVSFKMVPNLDAASDMSLWVNEVGQQFAARHPYYIPEYLTPQVTMLGEDWQPWTHPCFWDNYACLGNKLIAPELQIVDKLIPIDPHVPEKVEPNLYVPPIKRGKTFDDQVILIGGDRREWILSIPRNSHSTTTP